MAIVRRLTQAGIDQFREWLSKGAPSPAPVILLASPETSEPVEGTSTVEQCDFATRLELGEYLRDRLGGVPTARIRFDAGLWDWLSLFYINDLAPLGANGTREMKQIYRYTLELKNRMWSRHVVRMSWMAVVDHGKFARIMLALPITKQSEVLEQLAGQQEVFGARSVVEAADKLYWDEDSDTLKRGAQGKAAGTPRRLVRFMRQLRRTYDPPAMTADQLIGTLPREFERWKQSPRPSAKVTAQDDARQSANMA
ncbi:MAG: hypothetical protein ACLPID_10675 [Beijerinckiaceae bacterium]